ncbi:hypothetical protein [Zeimonas arvi]|uniref:Uncharacterized protein n=1 Tax=Zeimonas arvi TaxID=2498847 RepID=A0A5C8P025_9BURK|nr:hypothetical protein [Zeimonas arvi]TXL66951.1 hypothetical protein FHP08_04815 [Zeimonas arvi]
MAGKRTRPIGRPRGSGRLRPGLRRAALTLFALLAGCGYAEISILLTDSDPSSWWIRIESPTSLAEWHTTAPAVVVAGGAFVPEGSQCAGPAGTIAPGYRIAWLNSATGQAGLAAARLDCLDPLALRWDAGALTLATGSNPIVVTASDAGGHSASDTLVVWRQ